MNEKLQNLFGGLGKATLRGVRKCPRCGTYNGTRGLTCKNKACNLPFKGAGKKKYHKSISAVKIVTGSSVQLYSVRDRSRDQYAFVQLPLFHVVGNTPDSTEVTLITHTSPRCYAETCSREEIPNSSDNETCYHIREAVSCENEAEPLTLKNSVLNSLPLSFEMKQEIWLLATETTGPLVQRASKNVMVVKCKPDEKCPLGFLHFTFFSLAKKQSSEYNFHCGCQVAKGFHNTSLSKHQKCVHFYSCVCAFLSDLKLTKEFKDYLNTDLRPPAVDNPSIKESVETSTKVVDVGNTETPANGIPDTSLCEIIEISDVEENRPPKKKKKDDSLVQASTALLTLHDTNTQRVKIAPKKVQLNQNISPKKPTGEESTVVYTFQKWLASATERINQTMHFQFNGHPDPLVFHIPQEFFDCLQQRISTGSKKKRLPNKTTAFFRKDAVPLGMFSRYTWHITNILLVKQIFDTPEMPLELTRSFVENFDGSYDVYEHSKDETKGLTENFKKTNKSPLIKPLELKTILKVGNTSPDQKEPTPFIIDWIPNILPKSHVGELRIKFEYGHQRNGLFENQPSNLKKAIRSSQPSAS